MSSKKGSSGIKKILGIFSMTSFKENLKIVISRFPIALILIIITSTIFFTLLHGDFTVITEEKLVRVAFSLIITFFLSIGTYMFSESCEKKHSILQIIPIIFGLFFYIGFDQNIDNFENFVFFVLSLAGILSFLFFAPYTLKLFSKENKQSIFYTYFYNISVVFLTSFILSMVVFLLGTIAIGATFELFDLNFLDESKIYIDWTIISFSIVAPIFGLSRFPNKKSFKENHFNENIFFSFLIKYIAIPFIYIYFIILYAYTIKVLSNFGDWPKGEVSWMVIGFSIFGYITYIFSYIFEQRNKFITTFRKAFPYVVIPQIFMLGYAIYLRIAQYDITINRYFVVVFGLWLLVISIYYIFSKEKKLSTVTATLTLFTIIISIGPWSVYNLPESRQYSILKNNLKQAGILKDGKIIPLNNYTDIDSKLSENIYSEINYLCDFSSCDKIKILFKDQYEQLVEKEKLEFEKRKKDRIEDIKEKYKDDTGKQKEEIQTQIVEGMIYEEPRKWRIVDYITETIKVERSYQSTKRERSTIDFNLKNNHSLFPIDIAGYNQIYDLNNYNQNGDNIYVKADIKNKKIKIIENGKVVQSIDITEYIKNLETNFKENNTKDLDKQDLTIIKDNYKIVFSSLNIENPEYKGKDDYKYFYVNGYLMIK